MPSLGAKVLVVNKVLRDLPKHDQDLIIRSVTLHNVFTLPEGLDEKSLLFARLVRDADKLDILRVVIEYFDAGRREQGGGGRARTAGYAGVYRRRSLPASCRGEMARRTHSRP